MFFYLFAYLSPLKDSDHQTNFNITQSASKYKMQFSKDGFIYEVKELSKPTWPYVKNELPLLLNHDRTVIKHITLE